ncbi:MAG: hypothetical protein QXX34_06670 [Candidatus Bathyarchaeia archaeon]
MIKVLAVVFILALLLIGGALFCEVAIANFIPTSPDSVAPLISVISPTNKTYENKVLLHFNITAVAYHQWINHVEYTLDEQKHLVYSGETKKLNWSTTLEGLSEGAHSLQVVASCKSYYMTSTSGGTLYYRIYDASSEIIYFTVVYPPEIFILSPQNTTYETNNIQLAFTINEPASKFEYSLDGQKTVTIAGNTTLAGLNNGKHNVTIYAMDKDGHIGMSETVYFSIEIPSPTPPIIALVASAVIIAIGILVYFKKRNHKTVTALTLPAKQKTIYLRAAISS